jgi:glycosyltransferase involved in cell wall biosynthesis
MAATETASQRRIVSVIIPARNEEACLGECLQSLVTQTGVAFEIIVVDDHSTDSTRAIAASFPAARVIEAGPLPTGWTGKNNAVAAGAREAHGEWLLFTDADTVHLHGSLARALAEAKENRAELLSYSPEQVVKTFWEKAVMPVIFAELASQYRPSEVSDPRLSVAAANGQYILITREAYDAIGGHAALASELLEDVALARAVKQSGRKIFFRYGGDAVRARMYRNFIQLREGWTKNLAILFPHPQRLALKILSQWLLAWAALVFAAWLSVYLWHSPPARILVVMLGAVPLIRLVAYLRRANFALDAELLAITFGPPMFTYLLTRSARAHAKGTVAWKGRSYTQPSEMKNKLTQARATKPTESKQARITEKPQLRTEN